MSIGCVPNPPISKSLRYWDSDAQFLLLRMVADDENARLRAERRVRLDLAIELLDLHRRASFLPRLAYARIFSPTSGFSSTRRSSRSRTSPSLSVFTFSIAFGRNAAAYCPRANAATAL